MKLFIVIEEQGNQVLDVLAREALSAAALAAKLEVEISISPKGQALRIPVARDKDDILLVVSDTAEPLDNSDYAARFNGGDVYNIELDDVLNDASAILARFANGKGASKTEKSDKKEIDDAGKDNLGGIKNIVAITSCPTGIAHTFMAADALLDSGKELGINIRVETQGSVGAGTPLTADEIKDADLVIIAADREVDRSRFAGKPVYASGTKVAINKGTDYIKEAANKAKLQSNQAAEEDNTQQNAKGAGVYKHLMTGVSFMLPFVVAGGLLIAFAFAIGGIGVDKESSGFAHTIFIIGAQKAFALMVPILAGYIAFSIADRPGLAPGLIGGLFAQEIGAGFLGGIIAGFLAGYFVLAMIKFIKLPRSLSGLMPVLIIPPIATAFVALIMIYVAGDPVAQINHGLEAWLKSLGGANAALVGLIIGAMMAFDFGGPVNKAAYASSVALIAQGIGGPIAAAMIAGMTPPIALACASIIFPNRFTDEEQNSRVATFILGLVFISEAAIPTAARDPFRVIPSLMLGSAFAGALAYGLGTSLSAPHGGILLVLIPNVVTNYFGYFAALIGGSAVSIMCLGLFMRPIKSSVTTAVNV
ncbi:PTS fructose transporter subunit IIC [Bartonella sp. HY761]|uniref:PTS fructose transporter subunit IIC n=1 Tax=Bartonella sp. HY761 TaxID=2979330 RepID=UPI002202F84E|nr:fructose-specific PTS transporter subunit EIIC [Bartonella sp. HY761]UXN05626.1 fructose-specific PTS transporter subunit EIIC [Bartonella sp. HY761]